MTVNTYLPRLMPSVKAMRYQEGVTTAAQILAFCPAANIGTIVEDDGTELTRLISVPTPDRDGTVTDGDYIAHYPAGYYQVFDPDDFESLYEET